MTQVDVQLLPMSDAQQAFDEWTSAVISDALREELTLAAAESQVSLTRFVAEVLESFAAGRRLPKVRR